MTSTEEDQIKNAFHRVKDDIELLNTELLNLREEIKGTRNEMIKICEILEHITRETSKKPVPTPPTHRQINPTHNQINPTLPTQNPTHFTSFNKENRPFSTGNGGVPTDRQTDQQTDNTHPNHFKRPLFPQKEPAKNSIEDVANILDSLDSLKKEIRLKFKQLTDQEILIFSTLYQLEEEGNPVNYKILAEKLNLTESSIRDYIGRLLKKGIPVEKKKINNKQINLSISQSLKKIASLSTILQLRDI